MSYYRRMKGRYTLDERREIGGRIASLATEQRRIAVDIAKACGVSKTMAGYWLKGESVPGNKNVDALAHFLNSTRDYILKGNKLHNGDKLGFNMSQVGEVQAWTDETELNAGMVTIPLRMGVGLSAARLLDAPEADAPRLALSRSSLKSKGVEPDDAICINVADSSMSPVLREGGIVGINTGDCEVISGDMYAVDQQGLLRIRVLYVEPGGYRLKSYNDAEYPDERADSSELTVVGRIFWYSAMF